MPEQELITTARRPKRWDQPFGSITDSDIDELLTHSSFASIDAKNFPQDISLRDILRNDCRIRNYTPGDLVIRQGDYGGSEFYIISGQLRVVKAPGLPAKMLGRQEIKKQGFFANLTQTLFKPLPEYRDLGKEKQAYTGTGTDTVNLYQAPLAKQVFSGPQHPQTGHPTLAPSYDSAEIEEHTLIGEIAALGRTQRSATVYAETDAKLLEIRWQGLREIRLFDQNWRSRIDESYRTNMLKKAFEESPFFANLDHSSQEQIAAETVFETYGDFEWSYSYKDAKNRGIGSSAEPVIAHEGDYADAVFFIAAGFARVSKAFGHGHQTVTYLKTGDLFGYDELIDDWRQPVPHPRLTTTLSALGYVHVLRIPVKVMKTHLFPNNPVTPQRIDINQLEKRSVNDKSLLEWAVEERFINGTQVMMIDQERCVRCDDCVKACATTHNNNPRFIRHGKITQNWMVTNACMHCTDPVCMIGCPTGAIHRLTGGEVVINDATCIGCATCANACPYHNIRMVEIKDQKGRQIVDSTTGEPIFKATKCDLCASQSSGPACVQACPHDALKRVDFQTLFQNAQ